MADLVIGTAGHVDHGKTALVRRLTGQDTDRLPEERLRGISIDLGFASFELPDGRIAAIVDVPGHERFIKNMVAGATGIDLVLLVVAADEGVMPQTREHVDILQLLNVRSGLVVITKLDLVEPQWLELVAEDLDAALAGTFLADAPRCAVSSQTGEGLDLLQQQLVDLLPQGRPRPSTAGYARLPIDRVFTLTGFGTIVTGTVAAGRIAKGDYLQLLPPDQRVRVRQIQTHGSDTDGVQAGQRAALNLTGISHQEIKRGFVLAAPDSLQAVPGFTGQLQLLASAQRPLTHGSRVHLHTGTATVTGRILLLDRRELRPGETGFVRFRSEAPLVVAYGDKYVIRSYSPVTTIGGGAVLDRQGHYRRRKPEDLAHLAVLARGDLAAAARAILQRSGGAAYLQQLAEDLTVPRSHIAAALAGDVETPDGPKELTKPGQPARGPADQGPPAHARGLPLLVMADGQLYVAVKLWGLWQQAVRHGLQDFHQNFPWQTGMPRNQLLAAAQKALPAQGQALSRDICNTLLTELVQRNEIHLAGDTLRLPNFQPRLEGQVKQQAEKLQQAVQKGGASPPDVAELLAQLQLDPRRGRQLLDYLTDAGKLVKVTDELYWDAGVFRQLLAAVARAAAGQAGATTAQLRDVLGTSRKYAIPFLEYLDRQGFTQRQGERRYITARGRGEVHLDAPQDDPS